MRKLVGGALALALGCVMVSAAPAVAAEPCSEAGGAIKLRLVPAYVNAGAPMDPVLSGYAPAGVVSGLTVAIGGVATPVAVPAGSARILTVMAPATLGATQLTVTWEQTTGYGWPTCSGRLDFPVTVMDASVEIGDTNEPRVSGRWSAYYTPLDYPNPAYVERWQPKPTCDVGACDFLLTRMRLAIGYTTSGAAVYSGRLEPLRPENRCTVPLRRGGRVVEHTIRRAFLSSHEVTLRVTRYRTLESGLLQATRLEGIVRSTYTPTGVARSKGCGGVRHKRTRLVVIRR